MRLAKYFFVGGAASIVDIGLFTLLTEYFNWPWIPVSICTFILATLVNYFLSIKYVFTSGLRHKKQTEIAVVYLVSSVGLILNQTALYVALEWLKCSFLAAKISATASVFFWNYFLRKRYIF